MVEFNIRKSYQNKNIQDQEIVKLPPFVKIASKSRHVSNSHRNINGLASFKSTRQDSSDALAISSFY